MILVVPTRFHDFAWNGHTGNRSNILGGSDRYRSILVETNSEATFADPARVTISEQAFAGRMMFVHSDRAVSAIQHYMAHPFANRG